MLVIVPMSLKFFGHTFYIIHIHFHYRSKYFLAQELLLWSKFSFPVENMMICHVSIQHIHPRHVAHGSRGVPNAKCSDCFSSALYFRTSDPRPSSVRPSVKRVFWETAKQVNAKFYLVLSVLHVFPSINIGPYGRKNPFCPITVINEVSGWGFRYDSP